MPQDSATRDKHSITSSLSVGKIEPPDWLWSGLDAIVKSSNARNGVLIIFSQDTRGRVGIFCNRYISGAVLDGSGESGVNALRKLLDVNSGMFGFRLCAPSEGLELKQDLAIDLLDLLSVRSEFSGQSPGAALTNKGELNAQAAKVLNAVVFTDEQGLDFGETLGATGSYYSDESLMVSEPLTDTADSASVVVVAETKSQSDTASAPADAPEEAQSGQSDSGDNKSVDYLDWLSSSSPSNSLQNVPSLRQVLKPIMSSGVSRTAADSSQTADDDFQLYSKLVEEESAKVAQLLEQTDSLVTPDAKPDQKLVDDLRLLNDFLKSEQTRAKTWMASDLDAIPTPGKSTGSAPRSLSSAPAAGGIAAGQAAAGKTSASNSHATAEFDLVSSKILRNTDRQKMTVMEPEAPPKETVFDKLLQNRQVVYATYAGIIALIVAAFWVYNSISQRDHLVEQGIQALQAHKPDDALMCFGAAVANDPKSGKARFYRGLAYSAIGQLKLAIEDMDRALALGEPPSVVLTTRASLELKSKDYEKAVTDCTRLLYDNPKNVEAYKIRAMAHTHLELYESAVEDCNKALLFTKDPKMMSALYRERGLARMRLHQYREAVQDFSKTIATAPNQWTYLSRGEAYRALLKFEEAKSDYSAVIKLNPSSYSAYVARGICELKLKQYDDALADLNEALKIQPRSVEALIQRGTVYLNREQWQKAADDFQVASSLNPFVAEATEKMSTALHHLKKTLSPRTIAEIEKELPVSSVKLPQDLRSLMALGYQYMNNDSFDEAILCFSEGVRREPNNPTPRKYLAYAFAERGDSADALVQLDHLNKLGLLDERDKVLLGKLLTAAGKADQAIPILLALVSQNPQNMESRAQLAKAYYATGDKQKARQLATEGRAYSKTAADRFRFEEILKQDQQDSQPLPQ